MTAFEQSLVSKQKVLDYSDILGPLSKEAAALFPHSPKRLPENGLNEVECEQTENDSSDSLSSMSEFTEHVAEEMEL